MKLLHVGAAALNQTPLDWLGNVDRICEAIKQAREKGVQLLCLPELCITGYGCEDAFHSGDVAAIARMALQDIQESLRGSSMVVSVGLPVMYRNSLFNAAVLLSSTVIKGFVCKQHLAGDGIHYEPRWFHAWQSGFQDVIGDHPIGDLIFEVNGIRVGYEICEDAWVANRPGIRLAQQGVDVILNPSASHFAFGKYKTRERFVLEGSRAFGVTYVYANLLGNESGRTIFDGGCLIASGGKMVAQGRRFSFKEVELTTAVVDIDATRTIQARTASFEPDLKTKSNYVSFDAYWTDPTEVSAPTGPESWESSVHIKDQEFTRAVSLGLFDYARKSHTKKFVISLSGGADSAACAVLVNTMCRLAIIDGRHRELIGDQLDIGAETRTMSNLLLTCVYQGTKNSSDVTLNAARAVANEVGSEFFKFDIDQVVDNYQGLVEKALDRPLTWEADDIALQNIQARARAPGVWMIANIRNALLLATSNRSEAAVGYCTMDGDTAGSLSPIAGIDKDFLRRWLVWVQEGGFYQEMPSLRFITQQDPTAELRPQTEKQTDEKDLMPYDLLEAIEKAAIRDKQSPTDVFRTLVPRFKNHTREYLVESIEKFFRLWCRNQWKRERYAPAFHVDDENLDPRSWCRFPILSGGYEYELKRLRNQL